MKNKWIHFDRLQLPPPDMVLHGLGITLGKTNTKGYWVLHCPVHKNGQEQHPSLNLHSVTGHYRCHACGIKGRDILAFYRTVTGKTLMEAVQELTILENGL